MQESRRTAHVVLCHAHVCVFHFPGCPGAKKTEFLTSVLDALSTDMVHAVTDPASAGRYDIWKWKCSSRDYFCMSVGSGSHNQSAKAFLSAIVVGVHRNGLCPENRVPGCF